MGSKRCRESDNNPRVSDLNDVWGQMSISDRLQCLNDEYESATDVNLQNTYNQHNANVNDYITPDGLQTTLDKWFSNKNDAIHSPPNNTP